MKVYNIDHLHCSNLSFIVHTQDYTFPEDVAFPLGGNDRPFKIMLEVHYDNPESVNG